ncbi:MAG TPA: nucleotide exchange factor GrpE [Gammaproteobacteria bacterium]|jgi:molecular chaperone GrpE
MNQESGRPEALEPAGAEPAADEAADSAASPVDVEGLRAAAEENWNKYLRAAAELENLRKRNARDLEQARKFAAERLAGAILPVRDSLESSLAAVTAGAAPSVEKILEGERATLRLLDEALAAAGVGEIDPHGEPFDPARHEALSVRPSATAEPGTVLEVVQKGYEIHGRLLRPARVIVAKEP